MYLDISNTIAEYDADPDVAKYEAIFSETEYL
jgi:hypothetical protein